MEQDSFCGTTFNDGKLTVIGWEGRCGTGKLYRVHCSECAKDPELHGAAIFSTVKRSLIVGCLPCGCSWNPKWSIDQFRILLSRKSAGRFSVIVPEGANAHTKIDCVCAKDGYTWNPTITGILNGGTECPKCSGKAKRSESEAIKEVREVCELNLWRFDGIEGGWRGVNTVLELTCHCGCAWKSKFTKTVHSGIGCPSCARGGYDHSKAGWFYTYLWEHKETGEKHLKYGISNVPKDRIRNQRCRNKSYTATKLVSISFEDGTIAANLEKVIDDHKKANSIPDQVSKTDFPDGFTETLPTEEWPFISNLLQEQTMCKLSPL